MSAAQAWTPPPSQLSSSDLGDQGRQQTAPPSALEGYAFKHEPLPRKTRRRRFSLLGPVLFMVLSLGAGTFMVLEGGREVAQDAPLPDVPDYIAPEDQQPVGADGVATDSEGTGQDAGGRSGAVAVENADTGGGEAGWSSPDNTVPVNQMSTQLMEPLSVFVPEAKLYSLARPSDAFIGSKYSGMTSITIPDNPHRSVWHSAGGAMATTNSDGTPATEGTTFLGSHSGYAGRWGAYVHMAGLQGGETIWTKDAEGHLQRWQVDRIRYMPHTDFPQEYWNPAGPRRLVMTTCGGTIGSDGVYNENVFVEAKPVAADGSPL